MAQMKFLDVNGVKYLWGKVLDKISALSTVYAPLSHNHTISQITDLAPAVAYTDAQNPGSNGLLTAADKAKIDGIATGAEVNTIVGITYNGTTIGPDANRIVNLTGPTKVSELTNDGDGTTGSEFATKSYVDQQVTSVYRYKGSVANAEALPDGTTGHERTVGDVYDLQDTGMNVAWTGSDWDNLGSIFDASNLATKDELAIALTNTEIQTALDEVEGA